jgi:hypothetical protein
MFLSLLLFPLFRKLAANWQLVTHKNHCMEVNELLGKNGPFNFQVHGQREDY